MAVANAQTVVVRNHGGGTTIATNITTGGANSLIIATVNLYEPGAGNPTCSGVAGTGAGSLTFQNDITRQNTSGDSRIYKWSVIAATAGTYTITATHTLNALGVMYLEEVTGAATSSYTDGAGASATATGANPASGNFTGSVTDGYWSAGFLNENGSSDTTVAAGSGWTMDSTNGRTTDGTQDIVSGTEYRANPGSAGAFNGNFTAAGATWAAVVFVYKAASGASPVTIAPGLGSELHTGRTPLLAFGIVLPDVP